MERGRLVPRPSPSPRPGAGALIGPRAAKPERGAGPAGAVANERRRVSGRRGLPGRGSARARPDGFAGRERGSRNRCWRRAPGARGPASPTPTTPIPPAPPASRVPHLHVAGARECARARGGDGAGAWEGEGVRGPCPSAAAATRGTGPAPRRSAGPLPSCPSLPPACPRETKGTRWVLRTGHGRGSKPRLRTSGPGVSPVGNNQAPHPQPPRNAFPLTKHTFG